MNQRDRADRCPGVLRPWIAEDGALVRLRLIGGRLPTAALSRLVDISAEYADGSLYLTKRANVQLRAIAHDDGCVPAGFVEAVTDAGLLPHPRHELVRNVMVSPLSGRSGGRLDLRDAARRYDELVCADPLLATLSARFLVVLDDGRGDLVDRSLDLGAMAVDETSVQLRVGSAGWGEVIDIEELPEALLALAHRFISARGTGPQAPWHVDELPDQGAAVLGPAHARDLRTHVSALRLPYGELTQDDGRMLMHVEVPEGRLTPRVADRVLADAAETIIVTPWRSLLLPDLEKA